jgi:hypothetical protein
MSFLDRMRVDVGDSDPVWRYLLEKCGHVALLTLALHAVGPPLFRAAWIAAALYLVASKIVVRIEQHDWGSFFRDTAFWRRLVFIAVLLALVPALASVDVYGPLVMLWALWAWVFAFLALEHEGWAGP